MQSLHITQNNLHIYFKRWGFLDKPLARGHEDFSGLGPLDQHEDRVPPGELDLHTKRNCRGREKQLALSNSCWTCFPDQKLLSGKESIDFVWEFRASLGWYFKTAPKWPAPYLLYSFSQMFMLP